MTIKLIVGLGNFNNKKHLESRHNAGSWYVKLLANKNHKKLKNEDKFHGYTGYVNFGNEDIHLLIPTTLMNLSGKAVAAVIKFYRINSEEILIAHDELDLPPGNARFKLNGGHNGHNGLKNIINYLGNENLFCRLRIGIGRPDSNHKLTDFVLEKPRIEELQLIKKAINEAVYCTEILINQNAIKAMNRLHSYKPS